MIKSKEIRKQFIEFFESKKHKAVPSAPVIPIDDPTLLFTNAGMNQFKNIFLGQVEPKYTRVVDSQKCIRAGGKHNDLDEVGRDGYHHTFFEMLGNWSFGDYYKKEAISWAWELLTEIWRLPKDLLYATVHDTDTEAYELWKSKTDIEPSHIEFHGDKDNFWEMGNTGPCGPCSEIHIDRGEEFCHLQNDPNHQCKVNGDCHRYIELWNLVFIQFNRDEEGKLHPLKNKYVDTGAGFERICQVLQDKNSNYDTDLFMPIIKEIEKISGQKYYQDERGTSHRVIADHVRALAFAISDGEMPSNEGRGYVLRRILRRAAHHGRLLNLKEPFLFELVDVVTRILGHHYSELEDKLVHTKLIIKVEEKRFNLTLDKGIEKFEEIVAEIKKNDGKVNLIPGEKAFMLYDTFGFPLDLTKIMAEGAGFKVDEVSFQKEMELQKERARDAKKFDMNESQVEKLGLHPSITTKFVGYDNTKIKTKMIKHFVDEEKEVIIVLQKTPFYAESGGQVADHGKIFNDDFKVKITDVQKENDVFFHFGKMIFGEIVTDEVTAQIDLERRKSTARNHTATHLLHKALREILGEHVQQKGSLVHPDHLRFDFTHFKQVSSSELDAIERSVNAKVRECLPLKTEIKEIEEARKEGATALFGEKYGEEVRVISISDYSKELCGGTHLNFTGEIGLFKITSESSIASGIRRIEAISGLQAEKYVKVLEDEVDEIGRHLNAPSDSILDKLQKIISENKKLHIQLKSIRVKSAGNALDNIIADSQEINGVKLVVTKVNIPNPGMMRQLGDQLKDKLKSGIGVLFAEVDGKVSILCIVTKDLIKQYHAGKIVGKVAELVGGSGGGRPDMAMAGGKDADKINEAMKQVKEIIGRFGV
ncbi:MAG: alanine--tRNA ligase [Candidatus Cloacimonetes bacterium]|nr:alanine--tRNA ligase [Candidatus Cloacimonadota bacterium]MCF7815001.1 alanine--tRNA ligase [Candidatus Cloacimonadota bacterium]MCF7869244.1 alanine--tRNA ligase [Candidatus Cloacimonadota bacterium]MCF7884678.1 alanine--tRNA ligase [Candidatus Cloacimonadota bacterium]